MWTTILGWIVKSKAAKVSGGILGGTGALTLILGLHTNVTGQIEKVESRSKEYVQLKLEPFNTEIQNLKKDVADTKKMVRDIHTHLINN